MKRIICTVAAAAAIAGCGSDTTAEYRSGAQLAGNTFKRAAAPALSRLSSAPSAAEKVAAVDDFKASVDTAARDFERLHPPSRARSDNAAMIALFHRLSGHLARYRVALGAYDDASIAALASSVRQDFARLEATSARLGRDVGA